MSDVSMVYMPSMIIKTPILSGVIFYFNAIFLILFDIPDNEFLSIDLFYEYIHTHIAN